MPSMTTYLESSEATGPILIFIGINMLISMSKIHYEDLTEEEKQEENANIRNGLNFARKVLITEECEMLILDEILCALELGIVSEEEVKGLIEAKDDETELILTGTMVTEALKEAADRVVSLEIVK